MYAKLLKHIILGCLATFWHIFISPKAWPQNINKEIFAETNSALKWIIRPTLSYTKGSFGFQGSGKLSKFFNKNSMSKNVHTFVPLAGPEIGLFLDFRGLFTAGYSFAAPIINPYSHNLLGKSRHFEIHKTVSNVSFDGYYHYYQKFFETKSTTFNIRPFDDALFKTPPKDSETLDISSKMLGLETSYFFSRELEVHKLFNFTANIPSWGYSPLVHANFRHFSISSSNPIIPRELTTDDQQLDSLTN